MTQEQPPVPAGEREELVRLLAMELERLAHLPLADYDYAAVAVCAGKIFASLPAARPEPPAAEQALAEASAALDELAAPDPEKTLAQRIRDEFADFQMVIRHCSHVYDHMTDGLISKPNTLPTVVIGVAEDLETERTNQAIAEAREEWEAERAAVHAQEGPRA